MAAFEGFERLEAIFGPGHDFAESQPESFVCEVTAEGFDMRVRLLTWELTGEVDEDGLLDRTKPTTVELHFVDCDRDSHLADFNGGNVLRWVTFSVAPEGRWPVRAEFDAHYGLEGFVLCRTVRVVSAEPFVNGAE